MEIRQNLVHHILKHFLADLNKCIAPLDKTDDKVFFCESMNELAIELYNDSELQFDEDKFLLDKLYSRFREKLVPFTQSNLLFYFHKDEHNQTSLFQKIGLTITECLREDELQELFIGYCFLLTEVQKKLYLSEDDGLSDIEIENRLLEEVKDQLKVKMPNFNRARQTLIFYYLLKGNKVHKETHSVAAMARFVHNALGIPYSKIDNSEFYEKLKSAPMFKKESLLLKDLEYVKEQFQSIEAPELAQMVEEDIRIVTKALKWK